MSITPWIQGGASISITRAALDAVEADALAGYAKDEEACGYLAGPAGDARCDEHTRMVNTANKLHAIDPERYFRTAREFFSFNEKKFDDAVAKGAKEGRPIKVLYHSHLDAGAYFSPTDKAVMSMGEPPATEGSAITMGAGPAWPLAFLVTSVREGKVDAHQLFLWSDEARDFLPVDFVIAD